METPESGSAGDSPALNVSKTLVASGCVCENVQTSSPLVGIVAGSPLAAGVPCGSWPLPAFRVWGHCWGAGMPAER